MIVKIVREIYIYFLFICDIPVGVYLQFMFEKLYFI